MMDVITNGKIKKVKDQLTNIAQAASTILLTYPTISKGAGNWDVNMTGCNYKIANVSYAYAGGSIVASLSNNVLYLDSTGLHVGSTLPSNTIKLADINNDGTKITTFATSAYSDSIKASNLGSDFTVLPGNKVFLGNMTALQFAAGTLPSGIVSAPGNFSLTGESYVHPTTKLLVSTGGNMVSKDSSGNTVASVVVPNLTFLDSISLDGHKSVTTATAFNTTLATWTKGVPAVPFFYTYSYQQNAFSASSVCDNILRCSHATPVSYNDILAGLPGIALMPDGRYCIAVAGITDLAGFNAWKTANVPYIFYKDKNAVPTITTFDNSVSLSSGGSISFVDSIVGNPIVPKNVTVQGYKNMLNAPIGYSKPDYLTHTVGNQSSNALSGVSTYSIKGISTPLTALSNPYVRPGYTAIPTTAGTLTSVDSSSNPLSTVTIPSLYGNANIQDIASQNGITRKFSNEFAFTNTMTWTKYTGSVTTNGALWYIDLPVSAFSQIPKQVNTSTVMNMLSDKFTVVSENALPTAALGSISMSYNSSTSLYRISIMINSSFAADLTAFQSAIVSNGRTYIRYELATYVTSGLMDVLSVQYGGNISYSGVAYLSCDIVNSVNISAVTTQSLNVLSTAVKNLNKEVSNLSKASLSVAFDGVTDDSVAIQNAIYASINVTYTSPVVLPSGKGLISSTLHFPSGTSMYSNGDTTLFTTNTGMDLISIEGSNVTIRDLKLQLPAGSMKSAVQIGYNGICFYVRLERLTIKGALTGKASSERSCGIKFVDGDASTTGSFFPTVKDCDISYVYNPVYLGSGTTPGEFSNFTIDYWVRGFDIRTGFCTISFKGHNRTDYADIGVYCTSSCNTFRGFLFDPQRARQIYHFTFGADYNRYYNPLLYRDNFINNVSLISPGAGNYSEYDYVEDAGINNVCIDPTSPGRMDAFCSYNYVTGADDTGISTGYPNMYGMQDNCLSYATRWATVTLNSNTIASGSLDDLFNIKGGSNGFQTGVTFATDPSVTPIEIQIDFATPIKWLHKMGITFNDCIGSAIEIKMKTSSGGSWNHYGSVTKNRFHDWYLQNHPDNTNIWGLKFIITGAFNTAIHNTAKKVGISLIWGMCGNTGGNAYLPTGGGTLYGDLDIGSSYLKVGAVSSLPTAGATFRGKVIRVEGASGVADAYYTCAKLANDTYAWKIVNLT